MFDWLRRILTRMLSPEVLHQELLRKPAKRPELIIQPAPLPPPPVHRDPKSDTAVIKIEDARKEVGKAINEARAACDKAKRATAFRRGL